MKLKFLYQIVAGSALFLNMGPNCLADEQQSHSKEKSNVAASAVLSPAFITNMTPNSGQGGQQVEICGLNFNSTKEVLFDTVSADFEIVSNNKIIAIAPQGVEGAAIVSIINDSGPSKFTIDSQFVFLSETNPIITNIRYPFGKKGNKVVIEGINFENTTAVFFGSQPATILFKAKKALKVEVPDNKLGEVNVTVFIPGENSPSTPFTKYTYIDDKTPTIAKIFPSSGFDETMVEILGTNFHPKAKVFFGDEEAKIHAISHERIIAEVPYSNSLGTVNVTVVWKEKNKDGVKETFQSVASIYSQFIYTEAFILAPAVKAFQTINKFFTQKEYVNVVKMKRQDSGLIPRYYYIYNDPELTDLVAIAKGAEPLKKITVYEKHHVKKNKSAAYYIVAHATHDRLAPPVSVFINP